MGKSYGFDPKGAAKEWAAAVKSRSAGRTMSGSANLFVAEADGSLWMTDRYFGVRLEDDMLVTESGAELFTAPAVHLSSRSKPASSHEHKPTDLFS